MNVILKKDKLDGLLTELSKEAVVYVPKDVKGVLRFAPYISPDEMRLDAVNTMLPPKDMLFPQSQNMYHYGVDASGDMFIDPVAESADQVMFGVRPCDVRSIECLDDVFFTKGYVDEYYKAKRDATLVVAICCTAPAPTCFCDSMGIDPNDAPAADVVLRDAGEAYSVCANTDKGNAALEAWGGYLEDGEAGSQGAPVTCELKLDAQGIAKKAEACKDDPDIWDSLSIKCLNCGTCTFICPSCYCFDIEQENRCKEGVRYRCWDSCMFAEYTEMAGNHNPRPKKLDRVRNRFMHKLAYFEERYGKTLCMGCGRCVSHCPVGVDITMLIEQIGERANA